MRLMPRSASSARARAAPTNAGVGERGAAAAGRPSSSATTRPGRGDSTATRSARKSASSTSWVTSSTVRGSLRERRRPATPASTARVIESSAPNGSSSSSTGRPGSSVRRNATRWRMPPDSSAGRARSNSASPKRSNSGSARRRASLARHALALERQRGVAERVAPGQQQVALGHVGAGRAPLGRPDRPHRRRRRCRRRAPAARPPARAASTCRSPTGRRRPAPRPGAARRSRPSRAVSSQLRRRRSARAES